MGIISFLHSSLGVCVCEHVFKYRPSEMISEIFLVGSLGQNDLKPPPENHDSTHCTCTLSSGIILMLYIFFCLMAKDFIYFLKLFWGENNYC